jgi:predicted esterase
LQSFEYWYIITAAVYFIVSLILLWYYFIKEYLYALSAGIIFTISSLFHFFIVYDTFEAGELGKRFNATYSISAITGILYAVSLIFSNAGKRTWLKTAGVFMLIYELFLLFMFIWRINTHDMYRNIALEKIHQWTSLAVEVILFFFMANYLSERRLIKDVKISSTRSEFLDSMLIMIGIVVLVTTFIFGQKVVSECFWYLDWIKKGPERAIIFGKTFEARTYMNTQKKTLNYRLIKPQLYNSNKKYPLILCLHDGSGVGTDNITQIEGSQEAQFLSQPTNRQNYPAFLVVPQCPPGSTWGGIGKYSDVDALVLEATNALEKEFEIDQSRIYVIGESMGGFGTWHFICKNPKMFAAAIPICGGGDTSLARNIVGVPVWAFHGRKDRNVPVKYSRDMIASLRKSGGNPKYTEFPNEGHFIFEPVKHTPGLLNWLFSQKREN